MKVERGTAFVGDGMCGSRTNRAASMRRLRGSLALACLLVLGVATLPMRLSAQAKGAPAPKHITTPVEFFGHEVGADYEMINYTKMTDYWKRLATECDRMKLVDIGLTEEKRTQYMVIISSPENMKKLDHYRDISNKLAHAQGLTDDQAHALANEGKAIVWIDGGLHANETVGSQQLIEMTYQMCSRTDPETMRLLNDDIGLYVAANPDGQELVANWYMRETDPKARTMGGLPTLFQKYIGHDDNRDSLTSNMSETANMNHVLFIDWNPQIMYNHHQSGPAGEVIFIPPFRDPVNHNLNPLVTLGVEEVGTAMHERLVEQGKGGSGMRTQAPYDGWWDGGMRNTATFHNTISILTEIIGEPTPISIPLIPEKQLYISDLPLPVAPQPWHYRQSIDYEIENNRAILDYASRKRDVLLYNFYTMGKQNIAKGSEDSWTITPKRIDALEEAARGPAPAAGAAVAGGRGGRGGGGAGAAAGAAGAGGRGAGGRGGAAPGVGLAEAPTGGGDTGGAGGGGGGRGGGVSPALYETVLHNPAMRDPRGYIMSADQPDFPTVTRFINSLEKNGLDVMQATAAFTVNGKQYPAGSYVVKAAQAFRPMVREMFEPQDHPHDALYPGGPPERPYDIAGWTLAMQMGVQYDKELEDFTGPFQPIKGLQKPIPGKIVGAANPVGYVVSHHINNSFILINRLEKANADVYWLKTPLKADGEDLGTGTIWIPASSKALPVLQASAPELGITVHGLAAAPGGDAFKLKPVRIGLYDSYGGSMPSGWIRWLLEQYEFPFTMAYPKILDAGDLNSKFDVIIFADGAFRAGGGGRGGGGGGGGRGGGGRDVPAEFVATQGSITEATTLPQIKKFVEAGGGIEVMGGSSSMAMALGIPISNYMASETADGREVNIPQTEFYIPGSLIRANIDNTDPLAYGMPSQVEIFFENNPTYKLGPTAASMHVTPVAWYSGTHLLDSGWAWGQEHLDGGTAIVDAPLGKGKVMAMGPQVTFRGEPHGTFKLMFNGLYYSSAEPTTLH